MPTGQFDSLIVDASLAAGWFFEDERTEKTEHVLNSLEQVTAVVPPLFQFEMANLFEMAVRKKRITSVLAEQYWGVLSSLPLVLDRFPSCAETYSIRELAEKHRLTVYDAVYLETAQRLHLLLATLDRDLIKAANVEGVELLE